MSKLLTNLPMRYFFFLSISWCLLLTSVQTNAQNNNTITLNLQNGNFKQFVMGVEKQTTFYFYYNSVDTDSLQINLVVNNATITQVLQQIFKETDLQFSIIQQKIFVTRTVQLQNNLGLLYFDPPKDTVKPKNTIAAVQDTTEGKSNNIFVQNKLIYIGKPTASNSGTAVLNGVIKNSKNNEPIVGATVSSGNKSVITDYLGQYSLTLPKGRHLVTVSFAGMRDALRQLIIYSSGNLNIEMQDEVTTLKTVVVTTQRNSGIKAPKMGVERVTIKQMKVQPVVFGEADVLRTVLTLPGVTSVGEASTGFNVRGGSADQNLILFNDATVFNPSHLFGFFSAFNPNVVKAAELYKSSIPEKYGGRISSVLDVSVQEGNKKKLGGAGGIGPLTSHLMLEGPLKKEKSSFIIGYRTTYSDWVLKNLKDVGFNNSQASFYDLSLHITHQIDKKNFLSVTAYTSSDRFKLDRDTLYKYVNNNVNIKWKHIYNNNFFSTFTVGYDNYGYGIESSLKPLDAYELRFKISQYYLKADFTKTYGNKHRINFGFNSNLFAIEPGNFNPTGTQSLVAPVNIQKEQGIENALYFGDNFEVNSKLAIEAGIRLTAFTALGASTVLNYAPGLERDEANVIDTSIYKKGQAVKTYFGPEIRLSARYTLSETSSVKFAFNSLRQNIHMLSNTTAISPTDIWKLSDAHIKPQVGQQLSVGYYKTLSNGIELSSEVYYKWLSNYLDYKSGATLLLNEHIETEVLSSKGKAYGIELMAKKNTGKLTGWLSYTFARTLLRTDDPLTNRPINRGEFYAANFDKPHSTNLIANYKFSHRFNVSITGVYSTGRPITLPIAVFNYAGGNRVFYSDRNQYRIPDFFRADISMNIEGNHKVKKLAHSSWSVGVYNLTARKNPYSVYFTTENNQVKGYQLSIFGSAIPFVTYNFKF
jgi:hypothetical protein